MFNSFKSTQSDVPAIIANSTTITGDVTCDAELQLDGCVNGNLEVHQLTIGEKGVVKGNINADTLIILGKIEGDIHAKEVTLQPSAKVYGNIEHETLTIAAGAHIDGKLTHIHEKSNVTAIASSDKQ
ncbi:bactofilin family protein [Pseudoalteromonas 'SMAR']|uniref:bactofilin family protein n=1 Tax=Pseudoalteromonas 'SMAR' TaxID=3416908 RepID=UPI003AF28740